MKQYFPYTDLKTLKFSLSLLDDKAKNSDIIEIQFFKSKNSLNLQMVQEVIKTLKESNYNNINIKYITENFDTINNEQCKELEIINNFILKEINQELIISSDSFDGYEFSKVINANRKITSFVDNIKNSPYSTFEKLMLVYEFATKFVYNEVNENESKGISRHWITVLNTDKIVCVGYASIMKELCSRIFDEKELKIFEQSLMVEDQDKAEPTGHANNAVYIKDEKYGIDGIFYLDSCWDSARSSDDIRYCYSFCCLPFQDLIHIKNIKLYLEHSIAIPYLMTLNKHKQLIRKRFYNLCLKTTLFAPYNVEERLFYNKKFNLNIGLNPEVENKARKVFTKKIIKLIKKKKPEILESIKYVDLPLYLFNNEIEQIKTSEFENKLFELKLSNFDAIFPYLEEYFEQIINNQDQIQNLINIKKRPKATVDEFLENLLVHSFTEDRYNFIDKEIVKSLQPDIEEYVKNITPLLETTIPIEAFISGFKVIGIEKGLDKKELKEFVKNCIISSIERSQYIFEAKNCKHCLITTKIEDIEKKFAKSR